MSVTVDDSQFARGTYSDRRRYLWLTQPFLPLLPSIGCLLALWTEWSAFFWLAAFAWFGLTALLDELLPNDDNNPPISILDDIEEDKYYERVLVASVPSYLVNFTFVCWFIANHEMSVWSYIGCAVSMGIVSGLALAVGHEFGHKTSYRERWIGKFLLGIAGVGQFLTAHLRRHHVDVATPKDIASSRMGETLYHFGACRQQPGFFRESWKIEKERLARKGLSVWNLKNETLQQYLVTVTLFASLTIAFGWIVLPMLLLQMYVCWWYLSLIEYTQHYGLLRDQKDDGTYALPTERHSWNTNMIVSNNLLLNFVRHSPHHLRATRWYHALRDHDSAPQLPFCYPIMFMASMVPPLFWWLMNKRVMAWANGDLDKIHIYEPARERLERTYQGN
ncbi:MAG: alkane 1-monooxygenase [Pseudomonadota bacterium]